MHFVRNRICDRWFRERGYDGLEDASKRPKTTPLATAEELVMELEAMIGGWMKDRRARGGSPRVSGTKNTNRMPEVVSVPVSTDKQNVNDLLS